MMRQVVGAGSECHPIVGRSGSVPLASVAVHDLDIRDAQFCDGLFGALRDCRNDIETVDTPGWSNQLADQCRVPPGTGSELEDDLAWLELQQIKHAQHERWLRNCGGNIVVVVAKQC